ncbi:MAG: exosome complex RNA-binding protein Csl4 [Methanobacterium sp.]|uniref:exosome complex RNA-binding protein Csl4 n=1 Tax=Methanobacterium sp. TaxID=2164 RepID=UPI003D65A5FB|nr:exosome complex RNA-binding protein Csl4 [Methanobacterium sp.]
MKAKSGDFVLPGDILGVTEEFVPSEWTYEEEGKIKSLVVGTVSIDDKNKKISIVPKTGTPPSLEAGKIIVGEISDVRGQRASVKIDKIKGDSRGLVTSFMGGIHISQAQKGYLSKLTDAVRIGDIVEAKVTKVMGLDTVDLTTADDELGVLKAMCTKCRYFMVKTENDELYCPRCDRKERRKLSSHYEG